MTHGEARDEGPASRLRRERARLLAELKARNAELSARSLSLVDPVARSRQPQWESDLILKRRRPGRPA